MPEISVEVRVYCDVCGADLSADAWDTDIHVKPCEACMEEREREAERAGYERGYQDGLDARE